MKVFQRALFPALIVLGTILALALGAAGCETDLVCPENSVHWADESCLSGAGGDASGSGGSATMSTGGSGGNATTSTGGGSGGADQGGGGTSSSGGEAGGTGNQAGTGGQGGGSSQAGTGGQGGGGDVPLCDGPGESFPPCPPDRTNCSGCCVDTDASPDHCGSCGNACDDTTPFCGVGLCLAACFPPLEACGAGSCVNTSIDEAHCGSCRIECAKGEICTNGLCQSPP